MQFPRREAEIVGLAQQIARGLTAHPDAFPAAPVTPDSLEQVLQEYETARARGISHRARALEWTRRKKDALVRLHRLMAPTLRYAEYAAAENAGVVHLIGWGLPRKPTFATPEAPGQAVRLVVAEEGPSWVALAWQEPFDGGEVAAYRVQRRRVTAGDWRDVGSSVETSLRLDDQETGVDLEYRVMAVNDVGEGPASNAVRVVL